jgi:DNA-binding NarL/FixJ family response regulator
VARPGRIRDSIEALLKTISQVKIVGQVDNGSTALEMITEYGPDLTLLVTDLSNDGAGQILEHLKDVPRTQCLVLTNTILHMEEAEAAGADKVLLIGFPTSKLFETVTRLLSV